MSTSAEGLNDDPPATMSDTASETTPARAEPDAIRSAFVTRTVAVTAAFGNLADDTAASSSVTLRGAYLAHLDDGGTAAVGGAAATPDNLLRSAYAARLAAPAPGGAPARRPRAAKAARRAKPAKRVKAATRKAARPAKKAAVKMKKKAAAKAKPKLKQKARAKAARGAGRAKTTRKSARRRR
jgi:hypothetical protein